VCSYAAPRFSPRPAAEPPWRPIWRCGRRCSTLSWPAPYIPDWAGFYFGIHGGGWDHASFDAPFLTLLGIPIPGFTASGGVFGGHAGYNWQYGPIVGGLEVDFDGTDIKQTSPFIVGTTITKENKIEELASVRARPGWAVLPNLLAYGTAGLGWAHDRFTVNFPAVPFSEEAFANQFGWVAGASLEYRLFEHLLLRAEYLHYDFGRGTADLFLFPVNIRDRIDVVRAGISYKFLAVLNVIAGLVPAIPTVGHRAGIIGVAGTSPTATPRILRSTPPASV
jgi:outer membrane immunogenic protein